MSGLTVVATGVVLAWSERATTLVVSTAGEQVTVEIPPALWARFADSVRFADAGRVVQAGIAPKAPSSPPAAFSGVDPVDAAPQNKSAPRVEPIAEPGRQLCRCRICGRWSAHDWWVTEGWYADRGWTWLSTHVVRECHARGCRAVESEYET